MNSLEAKVVTATKWSALTEIASKLVSPLSGMILARLLTPEAYGAVATTVIIISFAEMLTDAGFKRYLIQHKFSNDKDKHECANTAFWINFSFSLFAWLIIAIFRHSIAKLVGSPDLGNAIATACAIIPITALSSVQESFFRRDLNFKPLFRVRMLIMLVPFLTTIPLAIILRNYWALIAGSIIHKIIYAIALTINSQWKPSMRFSFYKTKEMMSFWFWTSAGRIITYMTSYIDLFLISNKFDQYFLGIYRTSVQTSTHIIALISSIIVPVMLPTYSIVQKDHKKLQDTILEMQKHLSILILPIGLGIFLYSNLITKILLGSQWAEAAPIIGIWGLTHAIALLMSSNYTNAFIAIGKPHIPVIVQTLYAAILIPAITIAANVSFESVYITRATIKIWHIALNMFFIFITIRMSIIKTIKNILPEIIGCIVIFTISKILPDNEDSLFLQIATIAICCISYLSTIIIFKRERIILHQHVKHIKNIFKVNNQ